MTFFQLSKESVHFPHSSTVNNYHIFSINICNSVMLHGLFSAIRNFAIRKMDYVFSIGERSRLCGDDSNMFIVNIW